MGLSQRVYSRGGLSGASSFIDRERFTNLSQGGSYASAIPALATGSQMTQASLCTIFELVSGSKEKSPAPGPHNFFHGYAAEMNCGKLAGCGR